MIPLNLEPFIFDCEVFAYDWLFVFKDKVTGEYTEIWNDNEAVEQSTICALECGTTKNGRIDTIALLADALRISIDEYIGRRR